LRYNEGSKSICFSSCRQRDGSSNQNVTIWTMGGNNRGRWQSLRTLRGIKESQGVYHGCPLHVIMRCSFTPAEAHHGCTRESQPSTVASRQSSGVLPWAKCSTWKRVEFLVVLLLWCTCIVSHIYPFHVLFGWCHNTLMLFIYRYVYGFCLN
jgi:hypothetical protein